jgi:hypothetical protein
MTFDEDGPAAPSAFERFLVSPLGILTALTISAGGCLLLGRLF